MDCRRARQLVERRANRERLGGADLDRHLGECAHCRALAERASALAADLESTVRPVEPRAGFEQRVLHRLERSDLRRPLRGWLRKLQPGPAFAVGVAVGAALGAAPMLPRALRLAPGVSRIAEPVAPSFVPVGAVVSGAEAVEVLSPNGQGGQAPNLRRLKPDSTVWLAREGVAEVALSNGGRVALSQDSVVRFRENGLVLYRGAIDLDVQRGKEPFTVELPHGYVVADEAQIRVHLEQRTAKVEMVSGFAWLGNQAGSIAVADGERAEVRAGGAPAASTT